MTGGTGIRRRRHGGPRAPAVVGDGSAQRGPVHGDPRCHRGERGAAVDRQVAELGRRGPAVGRHRLRAGQRRPGAARRPGRGRGGQAPDLPGRPGRVHGRVAGQRPGADSGRADRRPGRAGARRRAAVARGAVHHHDQLRGCAAGDRAGRVGRARRGRRGRRGAGRRGADHLARLAVGVLGERARRDGGRPAERAPGGPRTSRGAVRAASSTWPAPRWPWRVW